MAYCRELCCGCDADRNTALLERTPAEPIWLATQLGNTGYDTQSVGNLQRL